jgi:transcriptional regulator with XRE-family HTH domain
MILLRLFILLSIFLLGGSMSKLEKIRQRFNLSRKDLATIIGRPIRFIVDVECNKDNLNRNDIKKLCDQFNLDEKFFTIEAERPSDMEEWNEVLGRNVKYYRELNGMTQQILAEELGFAGPATISGIERGIKPIGKKAIIRLSELFDIHVSELFDYHDPSNPNSPTKLIGRLKFVLDHKRKPKNWDALVREIYTACKDLEGG